MIFHINKKRNKYTQVANSVINDPLLSWKAKGILIYLLSKGKTWRPTVKDIINHGTTGRDGVYSGVQELVKIGYASWRVRPRTTGHFVGAELDIYESREKRPPHTEKPDVVKAVTPHTEKPDVATPVTPHTGLPYPEKPYLNNNKATIIKTKATNKTVKKGLVSKSSKDPIKLPEISHAYAKGFATMVEAYNSGQSIDSKARERWAGELFNLNQKGPKNPDSTLAREAYDWPMIRLVIAYSQKSGFWRYRVRSPTKLINNYVELYTQLMEKKSRVVKVA